MDNKELTELRNRLLEDMLKYGKLSDQFSVLDTLECNDKDIEIVADSLTDISLALAIASKKIRHLINK